MGEGPRGRTATHRRGPGVGSPDGAGGVCGSVSPREPSRGHAWWGGDMGEGGGVCSPPAPSHDGDEAAVMPLARGLLARAGM